VLLRGGRRDTELPADVDAVGDGVEDILVTKSPCFIPGRSELRDRSKLG
jgi:ribosomal protein S6E (S10)